MATLFLNVNNRLHQILTMLNSTREAWGRKSAKTGKTGVSSSKNADSWGTKNFRHSNSRVKSITWQQRN